MIVSCTDGKALVFGGWGVFGGNLSGKVELFDPASNSFTLIRDNLFAESTNYYVTMAYGDDYQHNKPADGKYIFLAKQLEGNQARLFSVDPATKEIAFYSLSQELPAFNETLQAAYSYYSPMVAPGSEFIFIPQVVINGAGYNLNVLMIDLRTTPGTLYIPPQQVSFTYFPMTGAKILLNDLKIFITGGNISNNFDPVKHTVFVQLTVPTDVKEVTPSEMEYTLDQNYPNAFNPSTNISFSLPDASAVSFNIYDATGSLRANLAEGLYTAGRHTVSFSAENLSSGIYYYTLRTGKKTITKKMSLIK